MTVDSAAQNMPAAEVDLDEAMVRAILLAAAAEQGLDRQTATRPLKLVANGWDNAMYRLGPNLLVRLPRRKVAVPLIDHEQRWLPEIAARLPLPIPVPGFAGRPVDQADVSYPWPWSIVPWFDGEPLGPLTLSDTEAANVADDLAGFLHALHQPAPPDAPSNPFRGVPLANRAERTEALLAPDSVVMAAVDSADLGRQLRRRWQQALAVNEWHGEPRWIHGDVHALNLVWRDGRIRAVIDFGDITAGDPATDLAVAWSLFPALRHRERFQRNARIDDAPIDSAQLDSATWCRARGWALAVAAAVVANSADHPTHLQLGLRTLRAVAADESD